MKYSVWGNLCVGIVCMMVVGCSNSEISTAPEAPLTEKVTSLGDKEVEVSTQPSLNLTQYLEGVGKKFDQLKKKHVTLVGHVKEVTPGSDSTKSLDAILVELTKKGEEVQFQIEAMKAAKGEDQLALQVNMDKTLAELTESYDSALAKFAG